MTNYIKDKPHLRLVFENQNEDGVNGCLRNISREIQFSFPYPEENTTFFANVETMKREDFSRLVGEFIPRWIFDVRVVPRLDTIAASRLSAFQMFQKAKAAYVDLFGLLGVKSYKAADSNPAIWGKTVVQLLRDSDRKGPYLFIFDDDSLFWAADDVLPGVIEPVIGKSARFVRIGNTATEKLYS